MAGVAVKTNRFGHGACSGRLLQGSAEKREISQYKHNYHSELKNVLCMRSIPRWGYAAASLSASQLAAAAPHIDADRASRSRYLAWQRSARRALVNSSAAMPLQHHPISPDRA
jgi:hypothetical protein